MKRRLLNLLTALSMLLCAAVVVLWVRSWWVGDYVRHFTVGIRDGVTRKCHWDVVTTPGWIGLDHGQTTARTMSGDDFPPETPGGWIWQSAFPDERPRQRGLWGRLGFNFSASRNASDDGETLLQVSLASPYWAMAAVSGALPAMRLGRWTHRHRRTAAGRCRQCGYDLRATPERCPECGATPPGHVSDRS